MLRLIAKFHYSCIARLVNVLIGIVIGTMVSVTCVAVPLKVEITGSGNAKPTDAYYYYIHLLELVFEKTRESDGEVELVFNDHGGGIERDRAMLIAGSGIDVMWASVTKERDQKMRAIDVDLLKGLNNYRTLIINNDDRELFASINSLDKLKKISVGAGMHWTDGDVMRDNGFKVVAAPNYSGVFKMLAARRFGFVSRGLHEFSYDLEAFNGFGFIAEEHILLKYDKPIKYCFFVNKNNKSLAERIERGLKLAQADGSFDQLFMQMPSFHQGEELLQHSQKTVLEIHNNTYE